MDTKKKKKNWKRFLIAFPLLLLVSMAAGLGFGLLLERFIPDTLPRAQRVLRVLVLLAGLYGSIFLSIPIHEAGHLVFGLLTGYRFSSYRIGSLMWVSDGDKVRFKRFSLAGTGGQCLMCPPDLVDGKMPYVLYNLGGALLNIFAALLALLVFFLLDGTGLLSGVLLIFAAANVLIALTNGVPMPAGTVDNDGRNAVQLGKHPAALRAFWIQMKANELISRGVRLKEMPEEWFVLPEGDQPQNTMCAAVAVFCENRLMDQGNLTQAAQVCDQLLEAETAILPMYKSLLACDRITSALLGQGGSQVAEQHLTKDLEKFMKQMKTFPTVLRTQYITALLHEKDGEKAKKLLAQFDKIAKTYPYPMDIESERELLALADAAAQQ